MTVEEHLRLYKSLKKEGVKYIVIGGAAAIAYGVPRTTNDLDLFIEPTLDNCKRFLTALQEAGLGTAFLTNAKKLAETELTIIDDIIRLDILTKVKGLTFKESWNDRVKKEISNIAINFISLDDLIKSKNSVGRKIDKDDIKLLRKIKRLGR